MEKIKRLHQGKERKSHLPEVILRGTGYNCK